MVMIIAFLVAIVVPGILIYAVTRPDNFRVQRSMVMSASPARIFPLIDDFHRWHEWSPYEKLDPDMKKTLSGAESGKGAVYEWEGNSKAGKGRMEITECSPPSMIAMTLDFDKPFKAHNISEFTMAPQGDGTNVTWAMHGPQAYAAKLMGIFMNMDTMVGKDFEAGLANMKSIVEK
ncbi:MAG: SRPBCC family protein [Acidobacteriota bacterium]